MTEREEVAKREGVVERGGVAAGVVVIERERAAGVVMVERKRAVAWVVATGLVVSVGVFEPLEDADESIISDSLVWSINLTPFFLSKSLRKSAKKFSSSRLL